MDLQMPVMDGFEAIEILRKKGVTIPIIALTANALSEERRRSFQSGATEFHTKPILREKVYSLCLRFIDNHDVRPTCTLPTTTITKEKKGKKTTNSLESMRSEPSQEDVLMLR
eukprot:Awhi_evm1s11094